MNYQQFYTNLRETNQEYINIFNHYFNKEHIDQSVLECKIIRYKIIKNHVCIEINAKSHANDCVKYILSNCYESPFIETSNGVYLCQIPLISFKALITRNNYRYKKKLLGNMPFGFEKQYSEYISPLMSIIDAEKYRLLLQNHGYNVSVYKTRFHNHGPYRYRIILDVKRITFSNLPTEIQLMIFSYISKKTLVVCTKVCNVWKQLACDKYLWLSNTKKCDIQYLIDIIQILRKQNGNNCAKGLYCLMNKYFELI